MKTLEKMKEKDFEIFRICKVQRDYSNEYTEKDEMDSA